MSDHKNKKRKERSSGTYLCVPMQMGGGKKIGPEKPRSVCPWAGEAMICPAMPMYAAL